MFLPARNNDHVPLPELQCSLHGTTPCFSEAEDECRHRHGAACAASRVLRRLCRHFLVDCQPWCLSFLFSQGEPEYYRESINILPIVAESER
jgi:hypothetical protein